MTRLASLGVRLRLKLTSSYVKHTYTPQTSPRELLTSLNLKPFVSMSEPILVLPRPGSSFDPEPPISGPSESHFTQTFDKLLPPAQYLTTKIGKAAYYEFHSTSPESQSSERILFIHGVQTPALGMYPLAKALHSHFPHNYFVLVDLWGHGLSDTPYLPHESSLFHGLIDDLLDHLKWPSAHLLGYSFGGALSVGYVASRTSRVQSLTLVAPAGLIRRMGFEEQGRKYLANDGVEMDEAAARDFVINDVLEGGGLVVPTDWKERVAKREVIAEAVKAWQMREHKGHSASVVGVFRDGGVMDIDEVFVKAVETGVPNLVVLGELDDVCTKEHLEQLGFVDVKIVQGVGHGVPRDRPVEVARYVANFWIGLKAHKRSV
jgi:pimeloyl-ACP methyl ester carboxylesterase